MGSKTTKTTATNPPWSTNLVSGLAGQVQDLGKLDPYSLIAGSNPLLDKAQSTLSGDPYAQARDMISAGAGGGGSVGFHATSDYMKNYQDPYLKDVLDTSLADYDVGAGRQTAQADLGLAGSGAFGGSGAALTKSMLGGEIARGRGALSAGIRSDAFNTAAGLGQGDATRATQTDATNAQLAESAAARKMQGGSMLAGLTSQELGQLLSVGDYQRQMEQQRLQAPISLLGTQTSLAGGLPLNLFSGQTSKTSGGTLGAIGSGLLGAASLFAAPMTGGLSLGGLGSLFGAGAAAGGLGGIGRFTAN